MNKLVNTGQMRVGDIIDHAARFHPDRPVLTLTGETSEETCWSVIRDRALRVSQALAAMRIGRGDTVGVLARNGARYLEVWYGVPGCGAALHMLDPELPADRLADLIALAGDRALIVDADLLAAFQPVRERLRTVRHVIVLADPDEPSAIPDAISYESWILGVDGDFDWVPGNETDACGIGHTASGGTAVHTHRSATLQAMAMLSADMLGLRSTDTVLPAVPFCEANGWSLICSAPMAGAAMMLSRDLPSAAVLYRMLEGGVTIAAADPEAWGALLDHLADHESTLSTLERVITGAACPHAVIDASWRAHGVRVRRAWGMAEIATVGTVSGFGPEMTGAERGTDTPVAQSCGRPPFSVDLKITGPDGSRQAWDDNTRGRLWARGSALAAACGEGWVDTGRMATMNPDGYLRIIDENPTANDGRLRAGS